MIDGLGIRTERVAAGRAGLRGEVAFPPALDPS